ncbi:ACT domain-containing protein [Lactobacillus sp. PV034]|uniref:ACT domain-containing protein n=1 Tax=Lactobacillus sp. PV034 TaxID=2594495 RepID=UPI00223FCEE8|nr:ACT domain-containing protein [Lactobacillus sp. PV034]QNQ80103.1 ACT domain-containing protein [Lactobacillus sp. PV034]
MKAILSVIGQDKIGIIAQVSNLLAKKEINILDVSQTIMEKEFVMMMSLEIPQNADFQSLTESFNKLGKELEVEINLRNSKIYEAMHTLD